MKAQALIGFGHVQHARQRPVRHRFAYPSFFLCLPMRTLAQGPAEGGWQPNQRHLISFHDADHGDGRRPEAGGALEWLDALLQHNGIHDANGEVWLHCYPRVLGFTFKPVSFWYCHRAANDQNGALRAIVVEVNNTFGERHCYLLDHPTLGTELRADKVFHVSPFNRVEGHYRFRFAHRLPAQNNQAQMTASIDYWDASDATEPLLTTRINGRLHALTANTLRRALWRYGAMTLMVVARIHWQALLLFVKRVPFFSKPAPPTEFTTR